MAYLKRYFKSFFKGSLSTNEKLPAEISSSLGAVILALLLCNCETQLILTGDATEREEPIEEIDEIHPGDDVFIEEVEMIDIIEFVDHREEDPRVDELFEVYDFFDIEEHVEVDAILDIEAEDSIPDGRIVTCDEVMSESHYCVTVIGRSETQTALVGLDTGNICQLSEFPIQRPRFTTIGWMDPFIYTCSSYTGDASYEYVLRFSTIDESIEMTEQRCSSATTFNDGIMMGPHRGHNNMWFYPSFEDVIAGNVESIVYILEVSTTTAARNGKMYLYFQRDSMDEIKLYLFPSGYEIGSIYFDDRNQTVDGMSVTEDDLLVLGISSEDRLAVLDSDTGAELWSVYPPPIGHISNEMNGLFCMRRE